ncbi:MAG: XRE family transcriptional regulator [Oscillospiraceae bacterium]|nr:XRE family transcriptional regulator [Oscillospiraceae bacterium]
MSVGLNIKKRRLELRMSQQELADAMGYRTRSTIAKIESGENDVSQKKLQKFAAVLSTSVEALIASPTVRPQEQQTETALPKSRAVRHIAVILAGGSSGMNRQNSPGQFVHVRGKPILVYCMEAYQSHPSVDELYVVCLKGWENIVRAYADQYGITKLKALIPAGPSGTASLKNAFDYISPSRNADDILIIQEATRPQVSAETISVLLRSCAETGSATMCHSMRDYVQFRTVGEQPEYMDRNSIIAVQSPEAHRLSLIREAFDLAAARQHTLIESCCTMLLYHLGYKLHFIESSINNIKIAGEEDIAAFSALVKEAQG